jgi:hypothetical protein
MNHEIRHALRRIGRGTASYLDEKQITDYIRKLEQSEAEIADAYQTATERASDLANEVSRLRKQLTGPAGQTFVVFLPSPPPEHGMFPAMLRGEALEAALRAAKESER